MIQERLNQIEQRANAATEGPWWGSMLGPHVEMFAGTGSGSDPMIANGMRPGDAEFIAASRTDVPDLVAAVRDVLDLHPKSPGQRWVGFPRADRQEHYCMADQQAWPCDTHRAIATALGEETP